MANGITRRDFMNGIAIAVVGAAGIDISSAEGANASMPQNYPPARDGLRGLLKGEAPDFPERFRDFAILASVRDFPARHASTLLALEATSEAISSLQQFETP